VTPDAFIGPISSIFGLRHFTMLYVFNAWNNLYYSRAAGSSNLCLLQTLIIHKCEFPKSFLR
jgi:hypothetical protein